MSPSESEIKGGKGEGQRTWTRAVPSVPISNRSLRSSKTESLYSVSDYRLNQERQSSQITTLRESELVSARAAVNNGVITPAIAPPPPNPSKNNLVPTLCAVRGGGGSLGAHGPQKQQLKSRRAARKRGKKNSSETNALLLGRKVAPALKATDETVQQRQ